MLVPSARLESLIPNFLFVVSSVNIVDIAAPPVFKLVPGKALLFTVTVLEAV